MRGLRPFLLLVLGTGALVAACERDQESGGVPTAPSLAPVVVQCSGTTVSKAVKDAFTDNTTRQNVQAIAQDMVSAFGDGEIGKATWFGFQIMEAVDTAGRFQGGVQPSSDLTVALFPCMALGTGSQPTDVTTELGSTGAYGVRGRSSTDAEAVIAHNGTWILEPPEGTTWHQITTLEARAGITGDTAEVFLALGKPQSVPNFTANGDVPLSGTFNWLTLPTAEFDDPFVVVGQCAVGGGFLQHNPATSSNAEIFGFVQPAQCPASGLVLEAAPRSLSARLLRAFGPTPAYAAALNAGSGGGTKPALSPFGIMNPGKVNLSKFTQSPSKSGNIINKELDPTPVLNPTSNGGVPFKQASVLAYLATIVNKGTPGLICYNWAYNDDVGTIDFPHSFITKAGGVQLFATSVGTLSTSEPTGQPVPFIDKGLPATSSSFNLKNDGSSVSVCPVFDGAKYFTNKLDPAAAVFTFDPLDGSTFPPNYDEVPFPGP